MVKKLKVIKPLIIGLGVAGKRHLDAQLRQGMQTGVYSLNINKTDPLRSQKNIIVFDNPSDAIDWSNLVHVCTPDDKHTEFVQMAIKKGKAVLCEKSFTTNLSDALYLQNLANEHKSLLLIGQNYRLTPTFAEIKKRILAGNLGTLKKIKTTYLHDADEYQKRKPLRKNKDFLYIGGSHAVDLACWIAGEKITTVEAASVKLKKNTDNGPQSYKIQVIFTSGLIGQIELDANSSRKISGTDLIVEGKKGKLVSHLKSDKLLFYKTGIKNPLLTRLPNNRTKTTALEIKIINDYLLGKLDSYWPLPDADEAVDTIKILDTIQKSASRRTTIVI